MAIVFMMSVERMMAIRFAFFYHVSNVILIYVIGADCLHGSQARSVLEMKLLLEQNKGTMST